MPDCVLTCSSNPPVNHNEEVKWNTLADPHLMLTLEAVAALNALEQHEEITASQCFEAIKPGEAMCKGGHAPVAWYRINTDASFRGSRLRQKLYLPTSIWVLLAVLAAAAVGGIVAALVVGARR